MKDISRRKALQLFTSVPAAAAAIVWTSSETEAAQTQAQAARRQATERGAAFQPKFFTRHEYATVLVLVDLIIPRDERSGSASDAGVPAFMDFMMIDQPGRQTAMRGGLAFIDHLCDARFDKNFIECTNAERKQVLDDLAYPGRVEPALAHGAAFFSSFRDLTASGFWTSKMGIEDLQYLGNKAMAEWKGCPSEALEHLGVKYQGE
jgi:gluconate 2-dehydrogenase gamma chain